MPLLSWLWKGSLLTKATNLGSGLAASKRLLVSICSHGEKFWEKVCFTFQMEFGNRRFGEDGERKG